MAIGKAAAVMKEMKGGRSEGGGGRGAVNY